MVEQCKSIQNSQQDQSQYVQENSNNLNIICIGDMKVSLQQQQQQQQQQLDNFIKYNTVQNCPQRSDQWMKMRLMSFGGSEVSSMMGNNAYQNQSSFFSQKRDKIQGIARDVIELRSQNTMDWGTFFEPIHRDILDLLFKTKIQESSMALGQGILKGSHQSPDGLSVIEKNDFLQNTFVDFETWQDKTIFEKKYLNVLWEQKSPPCRKPKEGIVPSQYIGQIKLGLSIFDVCDIACFSDSVFRISSFKQLTCKTAYNRNILPPFNKRKDPDDNILYVGFIDITKASQQLGLAPGDVSSKITPELFNQLMIQHIRRGIELPYYIFEAQKILDLKEKLRKFKGTYICWKLVDLQNVAVEKSQFFASLLGIFIQIGQQMLESDQEVYNQQKETMEQLSKYFKKNKFPYCSSNLQDVWYQKHQELIINIFLKYANNDWQSSFVLLYLLNNSQCDKLQQKGIQYIQQLSKFNENNIDQLNNLYTIITNVYTNYDQVFQQIIDNDKFNEVLAFRNQSQQCDTQNDMQQIVQTQSYKHIQTDLKQPVYITKSTQQPLIPLQDKQTKSLDLLVGFDINMSLQTDIEQQDLEQCKIYKELNDIQPCDSLQNTPIQQLLQPSIAITSIDTQLQKNDIQQCLLLKQVQLCDSLETIDTHLQQQIIQTGLKGSVRHAQHNFILTNQQDVEMTQCEDVIQ